MRSACHESITSRATSTNSRARSSAPGTPSVRARVKWGASGRLSGGQPSGTKRSFSFPARSTRRSPPLAMPIQRTRGWMGSGKEPPPDKATLNGAASAATSRNTSATADCRSSGVAPRKRRVRCKPSTRTQRGCPNARSVMGAPATFSINSPTPARTASETGTATKRRLVPGGSSGGRTKGRRPRHGAPERGPDPLPLSPFQLILRAPSIVVETLLDELLLHRAAIWIEAGVLEVLLVLQVDVVLAAAVLLHRNDDPIAESLGLVRVELDVYLGDDLVLFVDDQNDVGFVVDGRRSAQVVVAQALSLEAFLVRGHDRDHRDLLGKSNVLEAVDDVSDLLGLRNGLREYGNLLHVVNDHHQPPIPGQHSVLLDQLADVFHRGGGLRAAHQEEVLAVAGNAVQAGAELLIRGQAGSALPFAHPRGHDLLADVLDLDRASLLRQMGQARLERNEAVQQVLLFVLEADIQHIRLAAGGDISGHLHGHGCLARALSAADQQQLTGPETATDGLVQEAEAEGDRLGLGEAPAGEGIVEINENVQRRARSQTPVGSVQPPRQLWRTGNLSASRFVFCGHRYLLRDGRRVVDGIVAASGRSGHPARGNAWAAREPTVTLARPPHPNTGQWSGCRFRSWPSTSTHSGRGIYRPAGQSREGPWRGPGWSRSLRRPARSRLLGYRAARRRRLPSGPGLRPAWPGRRLA